MQYSIGDTAVYPGHGVGVIKRIEQRKIGGASTDFYVLQILGSGATLMIPATGCDRAGMRPVVSADDVKKIYSILRQPGKVSSTTWNRRFREFNDKLRIGSLLDTAEVLRDLASLKADKDLSYGEKKMLDKALSMIVAEVSLATGKDADDVEGEIIALLPNVGARRFQLLSVEFDGKNLDSTQVRRMVLFDVDNNKEIEVWERDANGGQHAKLWDRLNQATSEG